MRTKKKAKESKFIHECVLLAIYTNSQISFHVHFEQMKNLKFEIKNIFYACKLHECNDSTLLYESDAIQDWAVANRPKPPPPPPAVFYQFFPFILRRKIRCKIRELFNYHENFVWELCKSTFFATVQFLHLRCALQWVSKG